MIKKLAVAAVAVSFIASTPVEAKPNRGFTLYEDGSYNCTTDRSCNRAEKAQARYYKKMGWECLTSFDFRGCLDMF